MANPIRIPITITEEQLVILKKLMKQENRSRAQIASIIFTDGLKLVKPIEFDANNITTVYKRAKTL